MAAPAAVASFSQRAIRLFLSVLLISHGFVLPTPGFSGGGLIYSNDSAGTIFTWNSSAPVPYRVDGGSLGSLGSATATSLVNSMFQVWTDVPTANLTFTNAGALLGVGDGDVSTPAEFNAVDCPSSGPGFGQNPVIFDADGSLFAALGFPSGVIGFAGPGLIDPASRRITCALAALNGRFLDGISVPGNPELSLDAFSAAFIHEFGHFSGLDHSEINTICFVNPGPCANNDQAFGLPTMYPILLTTTTEGDPPVPAQKSLAVDDMAWFSRLYPETSNNPPAQVPFTSVYGTITGNVFFSDGVTPVQGANVIAQNNTLPTRNTVSVVSGYLFTGNLGQIVTGTNRGSSFGSRDVTNVGRFDLPVPAGTYTILLSSIRSTFTGGSSVGPLNPPIPLPGVGVLSVPTVTVAAGNLVNIPGGIVLRSTPSRLDAFESAGSPLPDPSPFWLRRDQGLKAMEEETA